MNHKRSTDCHWKEEKDVVEGGKGGRGEEEEEEEEEEEKEEEEEEDKRTHRRGTAERSGTNEKQNISLDDKTVYEAHCDNYKATCCCSPAPPLSLTNRSRRECVVSIALTRY
eukprot:GHVU01165756.1.p1 GENE.GHVU01165756.1~~GHVU01165756.1.p1  ORF type:complete len:112 (+),score=41.43 GHVU01165756.1:313-648(+)